MKNNVLTLILCFFIVAGCKKNAELVLPPAEAPVADFDYTVKQAPLENVVEFTQICKDATSYLWDFGDGKTATGPEVVHGYDKDGEYTVTLTAKGPGGEVKKTKPVLVGAPGYTMFYLSKITLPFHRFENYDLVFGERDADVFVVFKHVLYNVSSETAPRNNTSNSKSLTWTVNGAPPFQPLGEPITISFWDYDNPAAGDPHDLIETFTFKPSDFAYHANSPYPNNIYIESPDKQTAIRLDCSWQ